MNPKNVTLMMKDAGENVPQTVKTLNHCSTMLDWGAVRLFTHQKPPGPVNGEVFMIASQEFPLGHSNFLGGLGPCLFETDFVLYMQNDGYIIHPELWNDDFLQYDYISPPWNTVFMKKVADKWPELHCPTVGSGGFAMRSYRFCKAVAELAVLRGGVNAGLDYFECIMARKKLQEMGIRFAPPEVAIKFATEQDVEGFEGWTDNMSFGFHWLPGRAGRKLL